jgi:putative transposase
MPPKRFSTEQIVRILQEGEQANCSIAELCRRHGISDASYYTWRKQYQGMQVREVRRLKELEQENTRLKKLLAETILEKEALQEVVKKR